MLSDPSAREAGPANPLRDPRDRRLTRIAGPSCLVLFGVTGDLARKKLLPAMYDLAGRGLLPPGFSLVGFGRREWSDAEFAAYVREAVVASARTPFNETVWQQFSGGLRFVSGAFDDDDAYARLGAVLRELERSRGTRQNTAFYLSIPPSWFEEVCRQLAEAGLAERTASGLTASGAPGTSTARPAPAGRPAPWRRVVVEKPFGHDLASAQELNAVIERVFPPESVFRIDHYLGKETVQNILAFRFANRLFEPVWSAEHVDHVQITMAEDIGIGGRASYYDGVGAARDVIQNHLLQLLALTAMEEPISFDADHLRAEKEKVLAAVEIPATEAEASLHSARGQYTSGWQGGERVTGFLDEEGFNPASITETYAALKLGIRTRRWQGVPFYLRAGKRLGRRVTEIAVVFKHPPHLLFPVYSGDEFGQNAIVIRVQPDEGVTLRFASKVPGTQAEVRDVTMDFGYGHAFTEDSPEAYERLILDVLLGEPPLFPRQAEVELSWRIVDPFVKTWESQTVQPQPYAPGTWGPESADLLMARDGRAWRRP